MPGASGLELLAALSATNRPPPVLVVTGDTDDHTARTAKLLGARKVIAKPFALDELGREIDQALTG
jgi:CheY-like chemotaxis protein